MKITRYFQSCLLIEESGAKILIDPSGHEKDRVNELGKLDAVLYTHEHSDHFDAGLAEELKSSGAAIYANASTSKQMKSQPNVVADQQELGIKGLKIKAIELPHCLMWDGSKGPENTGYLVNNKLFHSGDGKELDGLKIEILVAPINGPDVSLKDAYDFAKQVQAKTVIPVHYDYLGGKPEVFADVGKGIGVSAHPLDIGQSVEL
jgi:L-ascorbate metabolism protein UlaG (beta-lactamase superfamily)